MGLMGVVRDVSVSLGSSSSGGSATFDGETASPSSSLIVGKVTGTVRFSDSQGQSSTCSQIQWSMQPYQDTEFDRIQESEFRIQESGVRVQNEPPSNPAEVLSTRRRLEAAPEKKAF